MPGGRTWTGRGSAKKYFRRKKRYGLNKKQKLQVRKIVESDAERKRIDTTLSAQPYGGNAVFQLLNGCATGDGSTTREGMLIKMQTVQYRLFYEGLGAGDTEDTHLRVILLLQKAVKGEAPDDVTDFLENDNLRSLTDWLECRQNFQILSDKTYTIKKHDTVGHVEKAFFKKYRKFPFGIKTHYDGSLATVASMEKNALWLVYMSDLATEDKGTFSGYARVSFTDI